jgi:aryl-alcohol dehydrogenase-like predicted oxidoreductase
VQYSVLERPANDVLASAGRQGMPILAYFPLASGLLTGKYRRGQPPPPGSRLGANAKVAKMLREGTKARRALLSDERLAIVERLEAFARERGHSLLELAISWVASQPPVASVIVGATRVEQVQANAAAVGWQLTPDDRSAVETIVGEEDQVP